MRGIATDEQIELANRYPRDRKALQARFREEKLTLRQRLAVAEAHRVIKTTAKRPMDTTEPECAVEVDSSPAPATLAAPGAADGVGDLAEQLAKLAELREAGLLSEQEFAAAKAKLLR